MPKSIYGPYLAGACQHDTTTGGSTACTKKMQETRNREIKDGATCEEAKGQQIIYQNTGRVMTLWTVYCEGKVKLVDEPTKGQPISAIQD